ncbi:MAG: 30S ribosomal protein S17 [Gammaproteobacteria bacterium]|jgi:small subunit ribosomal protein S17|nr:30S ribosomal protein S17 [Gammaproteobacteria bacterium]
MSTTENVSRTLMGRVISDKREATRTVEVQWSRRHARYGKVMKGRTKLHVHDPKHESKLGDLVEIKEVRPISKTKTWQLVSVLERAE